jgi:type I restriction enzyme S subunit
MTRPQTMPSNSKPGGTPKLRFPEFREAWQYKVIAPFLEECTARVPAETKLPIYSSTRAGLIRQDDYYGGRVLLNENEYGAVPPGCFVYRHMSDDGIFRFNINETGEEIAVSKEYPVFRAVDIDPYFLLTKLNHGNDFKKFALAQKAGGTRTRLYFSKLCTWETLLPSLGEQQKIAECLNTLDELIGAESQKLDALKAHKKGLMEQLFPGEGETLPTLRFPEFTDAADWEEKPLEAVADYENGKAYEPHIAETGKYVVVNSRFISTDGAIRKYSNESLCIAKLGDVMMVLSDLPKGRALAKCYYADADNLYAVNQRVCRLESHGIHSKFLHYLINRHPRLLAYDDGMNQTHLSKDSVLQCPLNVPPTSEEQQKIADLMTSLDDLIGAQTEKLEALEMHKKGLMQQLFPSPKEGA